MAVISTMILPAVLFLFLYVLLHFLLLLFDFKQLKLKQSKKKNAINYTPCLIHTYSQFSCSYCCKTLKRRESFLPGGSGFLKGLMSLEQLLYLIHRLTHVLTGHIWLLSY